jgi:protein-tyrosine phosphatase
MGCHAEATYFEIIRVAALAEQLANGKNVAVHCRQGIGRAGLVAISLLIFSSIKQSTAIARVGSACGCAVPETQEQRRWINDFAKSLKIQLPK